MLGAPALAQDAEFIPLGDLSGGGVFSIAHDVNRGASVVVGRGESQRGGEAAIWTAATGMQAMTPLDAAYSLVRATSVSGDGVAVAGYGVRDGENFAQAIRWTAAGGPEWLGDLPGGQQDSEGRAISADGATVVGFGYTGFGREAFRWTAETGMTGLGDLEGGTFFSDATDVSADGSVVVGTSVAQSDSCYEAFRWTQQDGMVGIGYLPGGEACPPLPVPGGGFGSRALAVSADGSVIVGHGKSTNAPPESESREAFRWTEADGMVGLGDLPGGDFQSYANGVSDDGAVIVGHGRTDVGSEAFVWTEEHGMQRLQDVLAGGGATGLEGWRLLGADATSADGAWVGGTGENPDGDYEAFLARLPRSLVDRFAINPGLNDAWANTDTDGQGFYLSVFPDLGVMALAWFTYDLERPPGDVGATLGGPGQRWLSALGGWEGNVATLTVENVTGGRFDQRLPLVDRDKQYGTITIEFHDCDNATLSYEIPGLSLSGEMAITRIVKDNVALCDALGGVALD